MKMLLKLEHPINASKEIVVTDDGMSTEVKLEQPLKTPTETVVTDDGMLTDCNWLQFSNNWPGSVVIELFKKVAETSCEQSLKVLPIMVVTLAGMTIDVILVPSAMLLGINSTSSPIFISAQEAGNGFAIVQCLAFQFTVVTLVQP